MTSGAGHVAKFLCGETDLLIITASNVILTFIGYAFLCVTPAAT